MALSAPTGAHEIYNLSIVIVVVSVLSVIGAAWIILSFVVSAEFVCKKACKLNLYSCSTVRGPLGINLFCKFGLFAPEE
jgi:hypothetical protein